MKVITIPTALRDYVESLYDTIYRIEDLLSCVDKNFMTPEEWNSSYEYFLTQLKEHKIMFKFALQELSELYKEEIKDRSWYISFTRSALICFEENEEQIIPQDNYFERFFDKMLRLYGDIHEHSDSMEYNDRINDNNCKDITFQVTDNCSMRCTYCYQHNKSNHSMDFLTGKNFIDMLLDADEKSNTYITSTKAYACVIDFIGGEPLLEIDLISQLSDYFINETFRRKHPWAARFMFSICTNGLAHFDPRVQKYLQKHNKHLSYTISIDGCKEVHDACRFDIAGNPTFDRCIAAAEDYINKFNNGIGSKITLSPDNLDYLVQGVETFIKMGHTHIHMNCVFEDVWTIKDATKLYFKLKELSDLLIDKYPTIEVSILTDPCGNPLPESNNKNWCGGTGSMIALDWQGNIFPCLRYMESSLNNLQQPFVIGNINDGINILDEHREKINCLKCITRKTLTDDECYNCPIAEGCGWCSAFAYEEFGTPNSRTKYHCLMHQARSLAVVYYQNKRGIKTKINCPKDWAIPIIGEKEFLMLQRISEEG